MSRITILSQTWEFNRGRTLATLDAIAALPDPATVLGWRPGPGRAHLAWQFMHIGVTEELFATGRLRETPSEMADLIPRYKGGSTPGEDIPTVVEIRRVLAESRRHLLDVAATLTEADLGTIPAPLADRGWTVETVLRLAAWHEPHHQGQAHLTLNLWKAAHPA